MKHVEKTLLARPTEANLGGVPSIQNKIRAYVNVKFSKMGQWTATNLEVGETSLSGRETALVLAQYAC